MMLRIMWIPTIFECRTHIGLMVLCRVEGNAMVLDHQLQHAIYDLRSYFHAFRFCALRIGMVDDVDCPFLNSQIQASETLITEFIATTDFLQEKLQPARLGNIVL